MKYFIGKVRNRSSLNSSTGLLGVNRYIGVRASDIIRATNVVKNSTISMGVSEMELELSEITRVRSDSEIGGAIQSYRITFSVNSTLDQELHVILDGVDPITCMMRFINGALTGAFFILIHSVVPFYEEKVEMKYTYYTGTYSLRDNSTGEFVVLGYSGEDAMTRAKGYISPLEVVKMTTKDFDVDDKCLTLPWVIKYSYFVGMVKHEGRATYVAKNKSEALLKLMEDHLKKYCFINIDYMEVDDSDFSSYRVNYVVHATIGREGHSKLVQAYSFGHAEDMIRVEYGSRLDSIAVIKPVVIKCYKISYDVIECGILAIRSELFQGESLAEIVARLENLPNFVHINSITRTK